jgi:hypothetical protein
MLDDICDLQGVFEAVYHHVGKVSFYISNDLCKASFKLEQPE